MSGGVHSIFTSPLPQATATARPTRLQSATLAKSVDAAGNPVEPGAIFGPDDRVYFSMGSGSLPPGTRFPVGRQEIGTQNFHANVMAAMAG